VVYGDVEQPETLKSALEGVEGVHINLKGGPKPEDYARIEYQGTQNVVDMAVKAKVKRISYLSGFSVSPQNRWFYQTEAKYKAEEAIKASGIPYTIFRANWFMESLPLFIQNGRASVIGKNHGAIHWVAAQDYAQMVAKAYRSQGAENKTLYVYGPEAISMTEALTQYCAKFHPELKVSTAPTWLLSFIAMITRNAALKDTVNFMEYMGKAQLNGAPQEGNALLGKPTTRLEQWLNNK
jgi:uncharacterized protein YbjT (DUF2867 family)